MKSKSFNLLVFIVMLTITVFSLTYALLQTSNTVTQAVEYEWVTTGTYQGGKSCSYELWLKSPSTNQEWAIVEVISFCDQLPNTEVYTSMDILFADYRSLWLQFESGRETMIFETSDSLTSFVAQETANHGYYYWDCWKEKYVEIESCN